MTIFTQWEKLLTLLAAVAKAAARGETQYSFNRIDVAGGRGTLSDRAVNLVALSGGSVRLAMPETEPGRARDLLVRATCSEATELSFEGAEFEGDGEDALAAPDAGETVVYLFTETAPGVFLASRKVVEKIGTEG